MKKQFHPERFLDQIATSLITDAQDLDIEAKKLRKVNPQVKSVKHLSNRMRILAKYLKESTPLVQSIYFTQEIISNHIDALENENSED